MGVFGEYIKSAISSIRNNKGRSFLTMLGIIIGISAVLTVLVIGDGMKATVNSEMDSIGATTVSVSLDYLKTDKGFTYEQLRQIEENIDNIYGISAGYSAFGKVTNGRKSFDLMMNGGMEAAVNGAGVKMVQGRYMNRSDVDDAKKVIIISQIMAKNMFGREDVVGEIVEITNVDLTAEFTIIGVKEDTSMDEAYASYFDDMTFLCDVPYTALADAFNFNTEGGLGDFSIYLDSENKNAVLSQARSVVENVMGLRGENAVKIKSSYGFDATSESILNIITSVVAIIAAISLLVGGIGVMNIMTVSVTERTREIGIRKSLGARTSSILTQFLAEAAILTFTGGIIGIILGLSISALICKVVGFTFTVNPVLVIVVVMISTGIGLFFGIYPARRAAKLDPIEALRTE
ncbi:MAG: ABC transporter permease [Butyrivibrio sp.]|nr:ABC transporter permease [Butyrivibrio sp.]